MTKITKKILAGDGDNKQEAIKYASDSTSEIQDELRKGSTNSPQSLKMETYSEEDLEELANGIYEGEIEYHTASSDISPQHSPLNSARSSRSNSNNNDRDIREKMQSTENPKNVAPRFSLNSEASILSTIIDDSPPRKMKSSPQVFHESDNLDEDGNYLNHTLGEEQEKVNDELLQNYYGKLKSYHNERKHLESELLSTKKRQKESANRFEDLKRKIDTVSNQLSLRQRYGQSRIHEMILSGAP